MLSGVSQEGFWIISCSRERIETFEKRNKILCQFRYRTCGAVDIFINIFLSTRHGPIQIAKLRKPICHISHTFIFQIWIQSKSKHTIIQQNVALQQQCCCAATDMRMQFSHETFFLQNYKIIWKNSIKIIRSSSNTIQHGQNVKHKYRNI
jgi:hypothetical protein